jgi:hypothetical protein
MRAEQRWLEQRSRLESPSSWDKLCEECDRLWREHSEASHKSFRVEARLTRAQATQDYDLVRVLATHLASLMHEQNRTSEAFVEHHAKAHAHTSAVGVPLTG